MVEPEIQVSKLDAARRQLCTAIRLYFHAADAVSIHTLTAAAYELLYDLNKKRGGSPMLVKDWLAVGIKPERLAEFKRFINRAENFFKHADQDPDGLLKFRPVQTEIMLYDACCKYYELTNEALPEIAAFKGWSALTWAKEFVAESFAPDFGERLQKSFSTSNRLSFYRDIMATALSLEERRDG